MFVSIYIINFVNFDLVTGKKLFLCYYFDRKKLIFYLNLLLKNK